MPSNLRRRLVEIFGCLAFGFFPLSGDGILNLLESQALAQTQTVEQIFIEISQLAEMTGSYHADVTTVIKDKGKTSVIKGKVKFKWPNMRWQENRYPKKQGFDTVFIISNGSIRWNYSPRFNFALKYDDKALNEDARLKGWLSSDYFNEGSFQYLGKERLGKDEMHVFEGEQSALHKLKNDEKPGTARVYVNVKTGILQKFIEYDQTGAEISTQTFNHIQPDASISVKDFNFTPPAGTKIQEVKDIGSKTNPAQ